MLYLLIMYISQKIDEKKFRWNFILRDKGFRVKQLASNHIPTKNETITVYIIDVSIHVVVL